MTKADLIGNWGTSKNISMLKKRASGPKALILSDAVPNLEKIKRLPDFFDIIIVDREAACDSWPNPDVYIECTESPYRNGMYHKGKFPQMKGTLICVHNEYLTVLRQLRRRLPNYVLSFMPTGVKPSVALAKYGTVSFGISTAEPGIHLAMIMGATELYTTRASEYATKMSLADIKAFTVEKHKHTVGQTSVITIKNLTRPGRGLFLSDNDL